jgi:hypothetical protein
MDQYSGKFARMNTSHSFPEWEQPSPLNHRSRSQVQVNGPPGKDHFPMDAQDRLQFLQDYARESTSFLTKR